MDFFLGLNQVGGSKLSTSRIICFYLMLYTLTGVESWSYFYSNSTMNWQTARAWCQEHYTDMVAIQDQEEISHLNNWLPKQASYYWIGIRKINEVWTWVGTNKPLADKAINWAKREPNNGKKKNIGGMNRNNEDCVEMYIKREKEAGKWNDERCDKNKTALCYTAACRNDSCIHGECVETINSHRCECYDGFFGDRCEHVVRCEPDEVMVPEKASVDCSHKYGSHTYDSVCQYSCEEGFRLSTSNPMRCTASGNWSEQPPSCELVQCKELSRPEKGSIECSNPLGSSSYQSSCVFTCEEGYVLDGSQSNHLQCGASGLWNDSQPTCTAVQCPDVQQLEHGTVNCGEDKDVRFSFGSSCSFNCAQGHRLLGSSTVTCTSTAEWSEEMPRCEAISCSKPKDEAHLLTHCTRSFDKLSPDSTCSFSCDSGFELQGAPVIQCSEEGTWNASTPTCKALQCPSPAAPKWGQVRCGHPSSTSSDGPYHPGIACTFSCSEGHDLQGAVSMECTQSGQWTSAPPACTAIQCPLLMAPLHGSINCSDSELLYSSQCSFACGQGFKLHGVDVVTCEGHGNWTGETPVCQAVPQPLVSPTAMGLASVGAVSLSGLSAAAWLLKRLRNKKGRKFSLNSNSDVEDPPQSYTGFDSLI